MKNKCIIPLPYNIQKTVCFIDPTTLILFHIDNYKLRNGFDDEIFRYVDVDIDELETLMHDTEIEVIYGISGIGK